MLAAFSSSSLADELHELASFGGGCVWLRLPALEQVCAEGCVFARVYPCELAHAPRSSLTASHLTS